MLSTPEVIARLESLRVTMDKMIRYTEEPDVIISDIDCLLQDIIDEARGDI